MSGSGADPDPLDSFGTRGTRGIRGGRAAKRKREAFLRYQESQGLPRSSIPVVNFGGQARPLYTPCTWEPETSSDEEPEVAEFVEHLEAPSGHLTLSRANPETILLKARPKPPSKSASSSSSITWSNPLLKPKSEASKPSSAVPSVPPKPSSAIPSVPPKASSAVPSVPPKRRFLRQLHLQGHLLRQVHLQRHLLRQLHLQLHLLRQLHHRRRYQSGPSSRSINSV